MEKFGVSSGGSITRMTRRTNPAIAAASSTHSIRWREIRYGMSLRRWYQNSPISRYGIWYLTIPRGVSILSGALMSFKFDGYTG